MLTMMGNETAHAEVDGRCLLDEIAREGARRMLVAASTSTSGWTTTVSARSS